MIVEFLSLLAVREGRRGGREEGGRVEGWMRWEGGEG